MNPPAPLSAGTGPGGLPMRVRSTSEVHIDLITTQTEVAELAKAAQALGCRMILEPRFDNDEGIGSSARLTRLDETWGSTDLAAQVVLHAVAEDESPEKVLESLLVTIKRWGMSIDRKPSDVTPIGEGKA